MDRIKCYLLIPCCNKAVTISRNALLLYTNTTEQLGPIYMYRQRYLNTSYRASFNTTLLSLGSVRNSSTELGGCNRSYARAA